MRSRNKNQNNKQTTLGTNCNNNQQSANNMVCLKRKSDPRWENIPPKQRKLIGNKPFFICTPYYKQDNPETSEIQIQPYNRPSKSTLIKQCNQLKPPSHTCFPDKPLNQVQSSNIQLNGERSEEELAHRVRQQIDSAADLILKRIVKKHGQNMFNKKYKLVKNILRTRLEDIAKRKVDGKHFKFIEEYRLQFPPETDKDILKDICNNQLKPENDEKAENQAKTILRSNTFTTLPFSNKPINILNANKDSSLQVKADRLILKSMEEQYGRFPKHVLLKIKGIVRRRINNIIFHEEASSAADIVKEYRSLFPPETDRNIVRWTGFEKQPLQNTIRTTPVKNAGSLAVKADENNQNNTPSTIDTKNELDDSFADIFSPDLDKQITDLLASIKEEEESENNTNVVSFTEYTIH